MNDEIRDVATITFSGPRFEDGGLELDVLPELLAYRRLLIETAKALWREEKQTRRRLPIGFERSIRLKFFSIEPGSAVIPIKCVVSRDNSLLLHYIDDAAQLIDETLVAVSQQDPIPNRMPKSGLPLLARLGLTLREGESIQTRAARSTTAAYFTRDTHLRIQQMQKPGADHHRVDFTDSHQGDFVIRDANPVEMNAMFDTVTEAWDNAAPPLWESIIDIGATLPPEEWERVPTDFAKNLEHYLYGSSDEEQ